MDFGMQSQVNWRVTLEESKIIQHRQKWKNTLEVSHGIDIIVTGYVTMQMTDGQIQGENIMEKFLPTVRREG